MVPRLPCSRALSADCPGEAEVGQSHPGRHNWGPYQGWPGTARGTCGEGRACVCACVCVCDDGGALGLDNIYMLTTRVWVSVYSKPHTQRLMTSVYTEFPVTKLPYNAHATALAAHTSSSSSRWDPPKGHTRDLRGRVGADDPGQLHRLPHSCGRPKLLFFL